MGFAGNLRTLGLPEVFQTLNRIQATGVLKLAAAAGGREIVFDQGVLIGVAFRDDDARQGLLRRLILDGKLDASDAAQISSGGRESQVVARLVEQGLVQETEVAALAQSQAVDALYELFTWDHGDFVFHDAGPDDADATAAVERCKLHPVDVKLNSLLMESARRQDEWQRFTEVIPDPGIVLGRKDGTEQRIADISKEYPASAILPLVDAVRSVDDIVKESVATRLDVYAVLSDLMDEGTLVPLTRDDIIYHGDFLVTQNDFKRAVALYRRALSARPSDKELAAKLADLMARVGDGPEAAQGYAQLALSYLGEGTDLPAAAQQAMRAVQLQPKDTRIRQVLVRCLLAQQTAEATDMAASELVMVADRYLELGQLEDARAACLQVLEIDKNHEPARRRLARIFASAAKDDQAEDVVICVQCGHVNHREAANCEKCQTSLQLTCLACGRVVGVSDKLCIFCGATPHARGSSRIAGGSPATSRIVDPNRVKKSASDRGTDVWRNELTIKVEEAKSAEAGGDYEKALDIWRAVATKTDNPELAAHIRKLEELIHDTFVERQIEKGHQHRRVRRFWSAMTSYKAALRTMSADDPRAQRLGEILGSTQKLAIRVAGIYLAAFLVIGLLAWMVAKPILLNRELSRQLDEIDVSIAELEAAPGNLGSLQAVPEALKPIAERVEQLPAEPRWSHLRLRIADFRGKISAARLKASTNELAQIREQIEQGDLKRAAGRLAQYDKTFPDFQGPAVSTLEHKVEAENRSREEKNRRVAEAPGLLEKARAVETGGRLGDALADYRDLEASPNPDVQAAAKAAVAKLVPRAESAGAAVNAALDASARLKREDLARAVAVLDEVAPTALVWNLNRRVEQARQALVTEQQAATDAARRLTDSQDEQALAQFVETYPGASESLALRSRHQAAVRSREAREAMQERYRVALAEKRYEDAWLAGRDLLSGFEKQLKPGEVKLPLVVETTPSGATITVDGVASGTTPGVLLLNPGAKGLLKVEAPGWQPAVARLELVQTEFRHAMVLARAERWAIDLAKPAHLAGALGSGFQVVIGDQIALIDRTGAVRGRGSLGGSDLGGSSKSSHLPALVGDRILAAGSAGHDLLLLLTSGSEQQRIPTKGEIRGRPIGYVNDAFGPELRVAVACEELVSLSPGGTTSRVPLKNPAISGPLAIELAVDRGLIFADIRGHLVGIEESTKRLLWDVDLRASDVGQLIPLGVDGVVMILDGPPRIACWQMGAATATQRWAQTLPGPAVGDAVESAGGIWAASGKQLLQWSLDGAPRPPVVLPAPVSAPLGASADLIAVGCQDGTLVLTSANGLRWTTSIDGGPITAVAVGVDLVIAATSDGRLHAFAP